MEGDDCPAAGKSSDCLPRFGFGFVTAFTFYALIGFVLLVAAGLFVVWGLPRRAERHRQAVTRLLDAADALEARLRVARSEIESVTGAEDASVRTALQEMLRQRLWLQQHGAGASPRQLDEMRQSIESARQRLDQQLELIEHARATFH